jgi:hypothetical protein
LHHGALLLKTLMGSRAIVIGHVLHQHPLEMLLVHDEEVVETFLAHRPDPPLRKGVGLWCVIGRLDERHALRGEDSIEGRGKFDVPIVDQEMHWHYPILEFPTELAGRTLIPSLLKIAMVTLLVWD